MSVLFFLQRIKALIMHPDIEWEKIKTEGLTIKKIVFNYALPLFVIGTISLFIRNLFLEYTLLSNLISSFLYFLSLSGSLILSTLIINEVFVNFALIKDIRKVFTLIVYSCTAFYLAEAVVNLHNQLALLSLFSLYSIYIFWHGTDKYLGMDHKRRMGFVIISVLIVFVTFVLMQYLLSPILSLTYKLNL